MPFKPGISGNPKGRPKKPNAVTKELRERIKTFLDGNFAIIEKDFQTLDPERRIALFERYLKFVLPELKDTTIAMNFQDMTDEQLTQLIERLFKTKDNDKKTVRT